ncbi:MAG: hypothetical protein ABSA78_21495 [Candidatus Sulfotelmatobacter sp.]
MRGGKLSMAGAVLLLAAALPGSSIICSASDQSISTPPITAPPGEKPANSGLYVKVQLNNQVKLSKLKPGDILDGSLARDVYSSDRELFAAGSRVRLTVDHMEKRKRIPNDHWPGVIKLFTPRHENYPVFKTATVTGANGDSPLQVSVISISRLREVQAQAKKKGSGPQAGNVEVSSSNPAQGSQKTVAPTIILEALGETQPPSSSSAEGAASNTPDLSGMEMLPAGTNCKILLLQDVSASKSKPGDVVQARFLEPVVVNSRIVLPAGTLVEGKVVKKTPPRWASRAGSIALTFTGLMLPGGNLMPISASLTGAELDRRSHTRIDPEGQLHGERPGKAWMAINIGVAAGVAKEADDSFQLIFEAIVSTATDASTAGTARIIATCATGIYLITRHGRDVVVPRFTEMNIALDRPLSVTKAVAAAPAAVGHGN